MQITALLAMVIFEYEIITKMCYKYERAEGYTFYE